MVNYSTCQLGYPISKHICFLISSLRILNKIISWNGLFYYPYHIQKYICVNSIAQFKNLKTSVKAPLALHSTALDDSTRKLFIMANVSINVKTVDIFSRSVFWTPHIPLLASAVFNLDSISLLDSTFKLGACCRNVEFCLYCGLHASRRRHHKTYLDVARNLRQNQAR